MNERGKGSYTIHSTELGVGALIQLIPQALLYIRKKRRRHLLCYKILLAKAKVGTVYISQGRGQERLCFFFFFFSIFTTIISILICHFRESSPSLFCRIAAGACDFPLCYKYSHCYSMPKPTNTLTARAPQLRDCTLLRVQVSLKNLKVFL